MVQQYFGVKDENKSKNFHLKEILKWKDFKFHYEIALEEDLDDLLCLALSM